MLSCQLLVTRIKNETGVAIRIPNDSEHSKVIRIEGDPAGVVQAKKELQEMAQRMVRATLSRYRNLSFKVFLSLKLNDLM